MQGIIVNFRRGRKTVTGNQMVIEVATSNSKEKAAKLVGKKVVYKTEGGKDIVGKVSAPHGSKGAIRARFETGMPGQAIGKKVLLE